MNLLHAVRTRPRPAAWLALPLLLTGLTSCENDDPNAFAPLCAQVGILGDAADYSDYGGFDTQPDLSRLVAHGSVIGVSGHCSSAADSGVCVNRGSSGPLQVWEALNF